MSPENDVQNGARPGGSRLARWLSNQTLQAAAILLVEIAAFLWIPLSRHADVYYSAADLTQAFTLTRVEEGHRPGNQLQSDAVTQMLPWRMLNREEFREGRIPLWNRWNGAGCPHLANYQSGVFSPFALPIYLFDLKESLLLAAASKLFVLGFFTYLFLRKIGTRHVAALLGATLFTFAGHNSLLLYFPHVGAMMALPAALTCVEAAFQRLQRARAEGTRTSFRGPLAGLTVVLLGGLLAGNPEPFYFSVGLVAMYVLARLVWLWRAAPDARERITIAKLGGQIAFASALAAGLAAFQILPFLEYLEQSRVLEERSQRQTPLDWTWWPLAMFPDVLGNPACAYKLSDSVPPPNYELVVVAYTGAAAMLMALLAPLFARRSGFAWFFALAGVTWVVYAYDLFGAADWFMQIPTVDMAPMNRSQGVWNFIVACSAALCVDSALRAEGRRGFWQVAVLLVLGAATWITCLVGADRLIGEYATFQSPYRGLFLEYVPAHIRTMSVLFAGTLGMFSIVWLSRRPAIRVTAAAGMIVFSFLSTGWLFHAYNPVSENRFSFPVTPAIKTLQEKVGTERLAILGQDMIPPSSNIAYHLELISNYDAMWVRDYDLLYRDHFGNGNNWRPVLKGTRNSLRIFGVQYVLAKWGWNWIESGLAGFEKNRSLTPIRREVLPGAEVTQTFRSRLRGLRTVMVHLSTFKKQTPCELEFTLEDVASGRVICRRTLTSAEVRGSVHAKQHTVWPLEFQLDPPGRPVVVHFEPQADSAGREYRIRLGCPSGKPGDTICAWSMPTSAYHEGESRHGPAQLEGEILFDWSYLGPDEFEPVAEFDDFVLYRFEKARPMYSIVRDHLVAETDEQALEYLRLPTFDPDLAVVLGPEPEASQGTPPRRILPRRRIVKFDDSEYVYLVAPDGKSLAHVDDEMTFVANGLDWKRVELLPGSRRAEFTVIDDADLDLKRAAGLILLDRSKPPQSPIRVLQDDPTRTHLSISNPVQGHLVVNRAHFPGWEATVNGVETPIYRANFAFDAIPLPAGDLDVRIEYRPASFTKGLWVALASLITGLGSLFLFRPRSRA